MGQILRQAAERREVERTAAGALSIERVCKVYRPEGAEREVCALEDVSLEVRPGEFVAVIGPSGCGKSTFLELIAGLTDPTSGRLRLGDDEIAGRPHPAVGVVFQEDATFPWRTVVENVEFGLQMRGVPKAERRERARAMIRLVGLMGFEGAYPAELSGGMRQRVAIARTLVTHPRLLLMDEPFGALDQQTRLMLGEELLRICQETGATVFFVTHSLDEAALLSDRIVVMTARPGRIKAILDNPLPRPRDTAALELPAFGRLTGELWHALREEVLAAQVQQKEMRGP